LQEKGRRQTLFFLFQNQEPDPEKQELPKKTKVLSFSKSNLKGFIPC